MALQVISVGVGSTTASPGTATAPAGARQAGDILFGLIKQSGGVADVTASAGWTKRIAGPGGNPSGCLYSRTATNTSGDDLTTSSDPALAVSNVAVRTSGATFTYGASVPLGGGTSQAMVAASLNAVGPGWDIVLVTTFAASSDTATASTPTNFTLAGSASATNGTRKGQAWAFVRPITASGATGTATSNVANTPNGGGYAIARILVSA